MSQDDEPVSAFRTAAVTPLVTVGRFQADPRHPQFGCSGPARWTSFVFPRRAVRIVRSSRERVVATPNVAMFYNAGEEYRREAIDPAGDHCDFFVLQPALLFPVLERAAGRNLLDPARPFRASHLRSDPRCYLEQRSLTRYLERGPGADGLLVEETVVRLLERLVEPERAPGTPASANRDDTAARRRALVERTQEYLALHFRESLTLADLAAAVDASPAHLARVFQSETGQSLHRFRRDLRLRAALDLVVERSLELTDVALELGFSSHSHFTWSFRREFELPPSIFRAARSPRRRRDAVAAFESKRASARGGRARIRARSR